MVGKTGKRSEHAQFRIFNTKRDFTIQAVKSQNHIEVGPNSSLPSTNQKINFITLLSNIIKFIFITFKNYRFSNFAPF